MVILPFRIIIDNVETAYSVRDIGERAHAQGRRTGGGISRSTRLRPAASLSTSPSGPHMPTPGGAASRTNGGHADTVNPSEPLTQASAGEQGWANIWLSGSIPHPPAGRPGLGGGTTLRLGPVTTTEQFMNEFERACQEMQLSSTVDRRSEWAGGRGMRLFEQAWVAAGGTSVSGRGRVVSYHECCAKSRLAF